MVENIEKILGRGDRIELLVDKTATMQGGAFHFKKQSKRLRRALWMKNAKLLSSLEFVREKGSSRRENALPVTREEEDWKRVNCEGEDYGEEEKKWRRG
uniref:V-SNARE coiled-coil homology domain-containing protein n=1 Tax=Salix viminalis TaxID=40686 RepID=A0A6N2L8L0_SALVM